MMKFALPDLSAVDDLGRRIAADLRAGDVVALTGPLGAGKTTLARAILLASGHDGEVPSPTFTILESYSAPPLRLPMVHADFYRLETPREVAELGLDEYRAGAALIAEWPGQAGGFAHEDGCLSITLEDAQENGGIGRIAIVRAGADWLRRGAWT